MGPYKLSLMLISITHVGASIIDDLDLNYDTLTSNKEGRHFLITTLLEKLYQPLSTPRFQGKVVFKLPRSLSDDGSSAGITASCCQLKDVPFKHRGGVITRSVLIKALQKKV